MMDLMNWWSCHPESNEEVDLDRLWTWWMVVPTIRMDHTAPTPFLSSHGMRLMRRWPLPVSLNIAGKAGPIRESEGYGQR